MEDAKLKDFEVTRELYKKCDRKWELDPAYPKQVRTDSAQSYMKSLYKAKMPTHRVSSLEDGSTVYLISGGSAERYTFTQY